MQIIVFKEGFQDPAVLEVPGDADYALLAQLIQVEMGIPLLEQVVEFEGRIINSGLLQQNGIQDGASVVVKRMAQSNVSIHNIPGDITPEALLALTTSNPILLRQFQQADKDLGDCLATGDIAIVRRFMMKRFMERHKQGYERQQEIAAIEADPMNPEYQKKIEEKIKQENIAQNMEAALENLPEAFGRVTMLYIDILVNGSPIKAFVDSGAQSTIMSIDCAERCGITRLIDTRFAGEARGVGTAKIIGRVHIAQMRFGNSVFPISITILERNDMDFLLGLDTLRRYRGVIDLGKNTLRFESSSGVEEVPFLNESELPDNAKGHSTKMEEGRT